MIYFVVMVITLIMAGMTTLYRKTATNKKTVNNVLVYMILIFCTALPITLVSGLRAYNIGTDTGGTYYSIYVNVLSGKISSVRDMGYGFINWIAIQFNSSYTSVLMLTALITTLLMVIAIFRDSSNPEMSFLLFFTTNFFFLSMNAVRQCIATAIFIMAIPYIRDRNPKRYFFMIFLAAMVHIIAIVYLPVYFISRVKLRPRQVISLGIVVVLFGNMFGILANYLLTKVSLFARYFSWYLNSAFNNKETNWFSLMVELGIVVFLLCIHKRAAQDEEYNILLWLHFIAMVLLMLSSKIPQAQRLSWLFSFSTIVYLPKMFRYVRGKDNRMIVAGAVNIAFFTYMVLTIFVRGYHDVVPYASVIGY